MSLTWFSHNAHVDTEISFNLVVNQGGSQVWYFVKPDYFQNVLAMAKSAGANTGKKTSWYPKTADLFKVMCILTFLIVVRKTFQW
jgi:hypothetical protein